MKKKFTSYWGKEDIKPKFDDFRCNYCSSSKVIENEVSIVDCEELSDNDGTVFLHMVGICKECAVEINNESEIEINGVVNNNELQEALKLFELSLVMNS